MKKILSVFFACVLLALGLPGQSWARQTLTPAQTERLETCVRLLGDVDPQDFAARRESLERGAYTEANLVLLEAVARTYSEIIEEQGITQQGKKEWLYSMVTLNMGYLQLGGSKVRQRDSALNLLIRQKLKSHIPNRLLENENLFYPLDYLD